MEGIFRKQPGLDVFGFRGGSLKKPVAPVGTTGFFIPESARP